MLRPRALEARRAWHRVSLVRIELVLRALFYTSKHRLEATPPWLQPVLIFAIDVHFIAVCCEFLMSFTSWWAERVAQSISPHLVILTLIRLRGRRPL